MVHASPNDHHVLSAYGLALALAGRADEAVSAGEKAVELMPRSRDALAGAAAMISLARIYATAGRHEAALALIEELLSIPSSLSVGLLRLDPIWDPLRDDPRFQALLETFGDQGSSRPRQASRKP